MKNPRKIDKRMRTPKWFFYDIGEENYFPTRREYLKRIEWNTLIFVMSVLTILAVSLIGLRTVFFQFLNSLASLLNNTEMTWLAYGTVLGIGGSLIFYNVADYRKSVHSMYITALLNIFYYGIFFLILNLLVYLTALFLRILQ